MYDCPKCDNEMTISNTHDEGADYYCNECGSSMTITHDKLEICHGCNGSGSRSLQGNVFMCINCLGTGKELPK
jgi:predicted RNA-binding Zn-ribbon protein involved in translation (DUF1610 family)